MPPLTITILGSGPAAPNPGGGCSGYLVRDADSAVLVDCGSGVASRIPLHLPVQQVSAAVISHLHPDHYFDLVQLYYMLKFGPHAQTPGGSARRLPVHVPPGGRAFFSRLGELIADRTAMLEDVFDVQDYAADRDVPIAGLTFRFHAVQHYVLSHAMRIRAAAATGPTLVFSSDVAPCPQLVEVARDADVFLCESALLSSDQDEPDPARRGHMTAAEAGQAARQAGARRLLITHYRSSPADDAHHLATASQTFGGPVELAREGATYSVG